MREIKFRIWCKQTEEMHTVERMGFDDGELWYVEDEDRHTQPPYFMDRNDSVLMQYTGLKDKNGREIYEGDVVSYKERNFEEAFGNASEPWLQKTMKIEWTELGYYGWRLPLGFAREIEIIGNIYENPELAEEVK